MSAANLSCCPWGKATGKESSTKYQLEQSGKEGELQNQLSPSCGTAVSHWMAVHGKGVIWNSRDWKAGESFVIVTWRAMSLASGHSMENTCCSSYKRITGENIFLRHMVLQLGMANMFILLAVGATLQQRLWTQSKKLPQHHSYRELYQAMSYFKNAALVYSPWQYGAYVARGRQLPSLRSMYRRDRAVVVPLCMRGTKGSWVNLC